MPSRFSSGISLSSCQSPSDEGLLSGRSPSCLASLSFQGKQRQEKAHDWDLQINKCISVWGFSEPRKKSGGNVSMRGHKAHHHSWDGTC